MIGMSCLFICEPFTKKRKEIKNVDLKLSINNFKHIVYQHTEINIAEQELVFCGKSLNIEENSLESYGIEDQVTIFVLKKFLNNSVPVADELQPILVDEIKHLLSKAKSHSCRHNIRKLLMDKEAVQKIISESEFIKADHMTMALLQNPTMFLAVVDTADAVCIATNYQLFGNALKSVIYWAQGTETRRSHDNDEEDNEDSLYDSYFAQSDTLSNEENQQQEQQQQQQQLQRSQTSNQTRARISASDLASALSFASVNQTGQSTGLNEVLNSEQVRLACEQVQALGITDENLIRRALTISGGNVEAAINLIFEEVLQ